jgi:hypothetical protein
MNAYPISIIAVLIDHHIRLRVYRGAELVSELPLRPRQACRSVRRTNRRTGSQASTVAAQLLNHALLTQGGAGHASVLQDGPQERVTSEIGAHTTRDGGNA